MTCPQRRLRLALLASTVLHALPFLPGLNTLFAERRPPKPPVLQAQLRPPPEPPPSLIVPEAVPKEETQPPPRPPKPAAKPDTGRPIRWEQAVRQQLQKLKARGQYYSRESIGLGLEGSVLVLFVLDEAGNVTGARVQESSGQALLDRDAVAAVKLLRGLPSDTPREVVLSLRFRLKE